MISGVKNNDNSDTKHFKLYQNYPNLCRAGRQAFNSSTVIKYEIPDKIRVFNILGKHVASLVNEFESQGLYEVRFKNDNLPSGIYIYRITTTGTNGIFPKK